MKNWVLAGMICLWAASAHSYTSKMEVAINSHEIKVQISYQFSNNTVKIILPKRAKLLSLSTTGKGEVAYYNFESAIRIDNVQIDYGGKMNLIYSLPLSEPEFYKEDWLAEVDEKGTILSSISAPAGFKSIFIPYESKAQEGFEIRPEEKPVLVCGKYQLEEDAFSGIEYNIYNQFKLMTPIKDISGIVKSYEELLAPLGAKVIVMVTLPALQNRIYQAKNTLFIILNNTLPDEIKRCVSQVYFRSAASLDEDMVFALTDYYRRSLDDNGQKKLDEVYQVPVPSYRYYEELLKKGFQQKGEVNCDVSAMLKNFAMLDFAYYTAGTAVFQSGIKNFLIRSKEGKTNLSEVFLSPSQSNTNAAAADPAMDFVCGKLLPVAKIIPDLSINGQIVYRNVETIPNITVSVNGEQRVIVWGNRRGVDLGSIKGQVTLDPFNKIPQLNYYNDKAFTDPKEAAEWNVAAQAIAQHKHYRDESFRDIINIEKMKAPETNAFSLAKDTPLYIGIVKFIAPVNNKLVTGLKEIIVTVTNGRPMVVADRIRI